VCGVCGIYRFDAATVTDRQVAAMMAKLEHRGPDDHGAYVRNNVGIGHRRLSILDLSERGRQPFRSDDGRYLIVHNGEVYNYLELREELGHHYLFRTDTDTEVILNAYRAWGESALDKFNGMFAFSIYDAERNTLFCARDRFGIKPLYYISNESFFAFASEIPALLTLPPSKPSPNNQAIFDYLAWNRTDHTDETFFRGVRKLPHGHVIRVSGEAAELGRWYDLREHVGTPWQSAEEYGVALEDAVKLRLRSDVPVGVSLSGGLDSSSILTLAAKHQDYEARQTFSAVYGRGETGDESEHIREFEALVGKMHYARPTGESLLQDFETFVRAQGEPVPSPGPYAQFKVMEAAHGRVVVLLDGQGADEQLAGYHYLFGYLLRDLVRGGRWLRAVDEMRRYLRVHKSWFALQSLGFLLMPSRVQTEFRASRRGCMTEGFVDQYRARSEVSRLLYKSGSLSDALQDHFEHKLEHLLKWQDRSSMWFSLESRVPFLDHRLVERTLALPPELLMHRGETKKILRAAMRGILPERVRTRQDKVGFDTPAAEWFRSPAWDRALDETVKSRRFQSREVMDMKRVNALRETWKQQGACDPQEIWKWISLETWFRLFID